MFANRFTVLVDACSLVPALNRNLLLSLAEAEFFRVRWSTALLDETERAIAKVIAARGLPDARDRAKRARANMERAFGEATVAGCESLIEGLSELPHPEDAHVIAAAIKTRAFRHRHREPRALPGAAADALGSGGENGRRFHRGHRG